MLSVAESEANHDSGIQKQSPFTIPSIDVVERIISDSTQPIVERMRCLYYARHHGGPEAVKALQSALNDSSVLLVHEVAYVLGQIGETCAIPCLIELLQDTTQHCMIRHEAAEALAAIGESASIPIIEQYLNDTSVPVKQTCELALRSLKDKEKKTVDTSQTETINGSISHHSNFNAVDPVAEKNMEIQNLPCSNIETILLNESEDLYRRYEALFILRDLATHAAYDAIIKALQEKSSALFRHEVAFVLGQIQTPNSIAALITCLGNRDEHSMARHEAALALGSVGANNIDISIEEKRVLIDTLQNYSKDNDQIVAESCLVALDTIEDVES